jgi:phage terminase small subunit
MKPRHQLFINEYIACYLNATEAYSRVYPNATRETARRNGHELLTNTDIAEEIKRRIGEATMGSDEVLMRLREQAQGAHGQYISAQGTVDIAKLIADGKGHLIKGIKETKWGKDIEFYDAQAALVHIGKHHKLFADKLDVNLTSIPEITADERAQADREMAEWRNKKKAAEESSGENAPTISTTG